MRLYALFLLLAFQTSSADVNVTQVYADAHLKYESWAYACELTELCDGTVAVPEVHYKLLSWGTRGMYDGGSVVYLNVWMRAGSKLDVQSTVIHEMIHYLHKQHALIEVPAMRPEQLCWSEGEAFRLVDQWLDYKLAPQMKRGPLWWKPYWHCEPQFDPDWDHWDWMLRKP